MIIKVGGASQVKKKMNEYKNNFFNIIKFYCHYFYYYVEIFQRILTFIDDIAIFLSVKENKCLFSTRVF